VFFEDESAHKDFYTTVSGFGHIGACGHQWIVFPMGPDFYGLNGYACINQETAQGFRAF
jgi:hypothetical protein